MSRYALISAIAGALDFLLALILLHAGLAPWLSLGIAIAVSGFVDYLALEWWGFANRAGGFSHKRLIESCLVELGTYLLRLLLLWIWKKHFNEVDPTEHLAGLAAAYLVAACFGYLTRVWIIFAKS